MNKDDKLKSRLASLREEQAKGSQMLDDLITQETELRGQLLRIGGAIQVLEEIIGEVDADES